MNRKAIVDKIRQSIYKTSPPGTQAILYGSVARGDDNPESDIDLLIIVDKDTLSVREEQRITTPLFLLEVQYGVNISPTVILKKEWENRPFTTPFQINVINEGIPL